MKKIRLGGILAILFVSIYIVLIIVVAFAKQDIDYNTNSLTCDEIRECILLDIACMEYNITNSLGSFEWYISGSFTDRQKDYYIMECVNVEVDE